MSYKNLKFFVNLVIY